MRKAIVNILATTGAALIIIAIIGVILEGRFDQIQIYQFQVLGVNSLIHLGLFFTRKFECKYVVFEFLLDICYVITVLIVFGIIFEWFAGRLWILAVMAVAIYALGLLIGMVRTREEADEINRLLQKRKEKNADTAS